ncbi:glycosyltransferase family 2 protein [Prochlorococcus sp. AH-716-F13]|nr:glycosyltransferase family 2 protein [Prochlorococcus sp. AH-716-F13]
MELPILILAWKRPNHTKEVIQSLKDIKPKNIYLACDGPNPNNEKEINLVNKTRYILENEINWPCKKLKLYSAKNQGCRLGVSKAINWFFENVSEGIILEDDCIAHPDFFKFSEILIDRFRDDKRIWSISGNNYQRGIWRGNGSYYFSKFPHCWGWATWKDRWTHYSEEELIWQKIKNSNMTQNIFPKKEYKYWESIFEKLYKYNKPDSWAYRWFLVCQAYGGLSVLPNINLVKNIGFDSTATHTNKGECPIKLKHKKTESTGLIPLKEPTFIIRSIDADNFTFINFYNARFHIKIINKCKFLINKFKEIFRL